MSPESRLRLAVIFSLVVAIATLTQEVIRFTTPGWGEDVAQHWIASRILSSGGDPYAPDEMTTAGIAEGLIEPGRGYHHFLERHHYPPLGLLLFLPFSSLSFDAARICWLLLSILALLAGAPLLVRCSGLEMRTEPALLLAAAMLFFEPVRSSLALGQIELVILLLLLTGLELDGRNHPWLAGGPFALATLVKILPGACVIYFVARRRWRTAAAMLAWCAAITTASFAFVPPRIYASFVVSEIGSGGAASGWQRYEAANVSLTAWIYKGFAFVTGGHGFEAVASVLAGLLAAIALGATAWAVARSAPAGMPHPAGMALLWTSVSLLSPLTWQHHLVWLLLPLGVAMRAAWDATGGRRFVLHFLAPYALVGLVDAYSAALRAVTNDWPKMARDVIWSGWPLTVTAGVLWIWWVMWRSNREYRAKPPY